MNYNLLGFPILSSSRKPADLATVILKALWIPFDLQAFGLSLQRVKTPLRTGNL